MDERIIPTILFVDDQPEVTAALELAFHKKPFKVHTANSASDALALLARVRIDVVISDEQMPVMSGSQFLTIVRRDYPAATRIILSGQANFKATLAAINEARAHHFLVKPCPSDEIAACIMKAIDERTLDAGNESFDRRSEETRLAALRQFDLALEMLWVAFQPIVRSGESKVFAYEALVRTNHVDLNSPYLLFDAAEEFGRVEELERCIRAQIAKRISEFPPDVSVMVNIHPRSLTDQDLYSPDSALFEARHRIIFEITERDKFHEVPGSGRGLRRLREMGYRVAVDDLGAGYAGLNSFATIKPDVVKFDMELIRDIDRSKTKCNLVRLMTGLCREMGILTVAEGIETEEEYEKVRELGCDLVQGFYVARPASDLPHSVFAPPEYSEEVG
jgi:EAL domain-containing protein (putative c-di-GMP-specific phosphodiesterase class I)/ActR/RegA family two-component response regulator